MLIKDLFKEIKYPIELYDKNKNLIYYEGANGYWFKAEYDEDKNEIYYENCRGTWIKRKYSNNCLMCVDSSDGYHYDYINNELINACHEIKLTKQIIMESLNDKR